MERSVTTPISGPEGCCKRWHTIMILARGLSPETLLLNKQLIIVNGAIYNVTTPYCSRQQSKPNFRNL